MARLSRSMVRLYDLTACKIAVGTSHPSTCQGDVRLAQPTTVMQANFSGDYCPQVPVALPCANVLMVAHQFCRGRRRMAKSDVSASLEEEIPLGYGSAVVGRGYFNFSVVGGTHSWVWDRVLKVEWRLTTAPDLKSR